MRAIKKISKFFLILIGILVLLFGIFALYVYNIADATPPKIDTASAQIKMTTPQLQDSNTYTIGDNWITKNKYGLYEMYISGKPYERGLIAGELSKNLIVDQEIAFTDQIKKMIPSPGYLKFLKYIIGFMNRDLSSHVTQEYQEEILGISKSASDRFDWIGTQYSRILNYHAAHDIGHAMQNLMLVGCTSFGAWSGKTADSSMIIGRNFDFWVGDEFAKNKIVEFVAPDSGYNFAYITWGGFIGVVSGMNDQGLTVTINAAPSQIPYNAATPVSLVAREILQYAKNIEQAIKIAHSRKMFVSESFLVGSAIDRKAVVIEKTPDTLDVFYPSDNNITCTNHYQGTELVKEEHNMEQMKNSASVYRQKRLLQLMDANYPLTPDKVANILRDQKGLNDADIGLGNEKAINQLIAHHSIIMMPDSLRFWVSTSPWQLGTYVCYDLKKVFAQKAKPHQGTVATETLNIAADTFLNTPEYNNYLYFRLVKNNTAFGKTYAFNPDSLMFSNPSYYDTYRILGDYYTRNKNKVKAEEMYTMALKKEMATEGERKAIQKKIEALKK
ncbi:peptidase C45 [Taibaiella sp. KBW10]|uniref:C45 family autoproteolytic acyltransferase/hydolase n=1 Tax=Taibaiella sp. KBW10 TaxID=2153357 RepID=UPI000F5B16EF|nr:C45 family peptidase [Taibaiella sp. KBW10]RQO30246.1 peptidase C45 [Taibaiella sp. KBW10]